MISQITQGIQVSVQTYYQEDQSNPFMNEYLFAYKIQIENLNAFAIKLLARKWFIFDSNGVNREVEGEGVVGVQPILNSGETFEYMSGCNLRTELGKMSGFYQFQNLTTMELMQVSIPAFDLFAPFKWN